MGLNTFIYSLLAPGLLAALLYHLNIFAKYYRDTLQTLWVGSIVIALLISLIFYATAWKFTKIPSWSSYFIVVTALGVSSFDLITAIDLWLMPNGIFLSEFLQAEDPLVHNIGTTAFIVFIASILHLIHLLSLYQLSSRTLLMSRRFTLSNKRVSGIISQLLALVTVPLLLATSVIIVAEALVLVGVKHELLDIIRTNDPIIFLNDIVLGHFNSTKPTYLWEVSIISFGFILTGQAIFIGSSFLWKTPKSLQADPNNPIFWIINTLPVVAGLMQAISLVPYRVPVVSTKTVSTKSKTKKRS